jgi:hypothetical protein
LINFAKKHGLSLDWLLLRDAEHEEIDPAISFRYSQLQKILSGEYDHMKEELAFYLDKLEKNYHQAKKNQERMSQFEALAMINKQKEEEKGMGGVIPVLSLTQLSILRIMPIRQHPDRYRRENPAEPAASLDGPRNRDADQVSTQVEESTQKKWKEVDPGETGKWWTLP